MFNLGLVNYSFLFRGSNKTALIMKKNYAC
jgi:hypothetical protein